MINLDEKLLHVNSNVRYANLRVLIAKIFLART